MARLLVAADLHPKKRGSLEQQLIGVAQRLGERGVATSFFFSRPPIETVARELAAAHAAVGTLDFRHPWHAARQLRQAIRTLRPEIVHLHFLRPFSPVVLGTSSLRSGPRIILNEHLTLAPGTGPRRWLKRALGPLCNAGIARRIAVSRWVANSLVDAEGIDPMTVRVIENGIDIKRFASADGAAARVRLFPGASPRTTWIVCLARMAPEKGVDIAIDAAARLLAQGRPVLLLIAGDGAGEGDMRARAGRLGIADRILFLGLRDDVESVLASADQVWVPSRNEAFGLAAVEAMASGRPVVASRAGALPEVVQDGQVGWLIPVDDDAALADAAAALIDDPERAQAMGRAGRRLAEERFAIERCIGEVLSLYRELVPQWP